MTPSDSSTAASHPKQDGRAQARDIFESAWRELETETNSAELNFPKEIFWLNGAPGAGKGTHTASILRHLGHKNAPIVTSDLLQSPQARKLMDAGQLVGDFEVLGLLLRKLLEPQLREGVIVDGFPRTLVQVEFLRVFHAKLSVLNAARGRAAPCFSILVLFVDEDESVRRQMKRGGEARNANAAGETREVRKTDLDPELARNRFRVFMRKTYEPLQTLRDVFPFYLVNSTGSIAEVGRRIVNTLRQPPPPRLP
jgi:adenylate kinase